MYVYMYIYIYILFLCYIARGGGRDRRHPPALRATRLALRPVFQEASRVTSNMVLPPE